MQQRKQKKILRINSLKLLHLDYRNDQITQESLEQVLMAVSPKALYVNNSSLVNSNVQQLLGVALAKSQHDRLSSLAQSDLMMRRASVLLL